MSALYPFPEHHLDLDGLRYHYVDEGNIGDGRSPMVMVHGNPSWSFYYRNLIKAFSNSHRCIAMDHIGCGRSDKPSDDRYEYTLRRRIDDLARLIDHLELERITLVVHDWGGMIGMGWATRFPQRVERILVLNTAAFHLPRGSSIPFSLKLARTPGLGGLLVRGLNGFSLAANRLCVSRKPMPPDVSRGYLAPYDSWRNRIAVHRFVQDIPLAPSDRAYAVVSETADKLGLLVEKPMMICWGGKDFVFGRAYLAEWIRRFPDARVHQFADAGHYVLEDAGDEIADLLGDFTGSDPTNPDATH